MAFLLGFSSVLSQVVLMRELVSVFYGNELVYAVILAAWLFWVAMGNFCASSFIQNVRCPKNIIAILFFLFIIFLPATVISSRLVNNFMHIQTGEIMGIIPMTALSFLLLAPLTMVIGGLFTLICRYKEEGREQEAVVMGAGSVYLWEAIGGGIGGLIFSAFLIKLFSAFSIVFFLCALVFLVLILLFVKRKARTFIILGELIIVFLCYASGFLRWADEWSRDKRWEGLEVVSSAESIYGNITITKLKDTYQLYENGLLSFATKDDLSSEEGVHYAMLAHAHPRPRHVLLIGSGLDGSIKEILKYPDIKVTYIELDGKVIDLAQKYMPSDVVAPLNDPRVETIITDARQFIKRRDAPLFDVVIVNLGDPITALINRYYTLEYFKETFRVLKPQGIMALSVSSSENYLNKETKEFLRSINSTLKQVFPDVRSIPGDTHIFLASRDPEGLNINIDIFIRSLERWGVETRYVREYYFSYRMSPDRMDYINDVLQTPGRINTDAKPVAYLFDIVLWSTHFNQGFKDVFHKISWLRFKHLLVVPLVVLVGGWLLRKRRPFSPITLSIMTTGFSEVIFQIVIILSFQALYGYAYYKIGFIMASFMSGLALGTLFARKLIRSILPLPSIEKKKKLVKIYKWTQWSICLYPLLLPVFFVYFQHVGSEIFSSAFFASVFASLPIIAGFIGGLQYPLAVCIRGEAFEADINKGGSASKNAGFLYAMDVSGATIGALVTGAVLVPLLGINAVVYFCAAINFAVLLLL